MASRTSMKITDERAQLEDKCRQILDDDLPPENYRSKLYDMAMQHLIESHGNLEDMKRELTPEQAEKVSTSVLSLTMYPRVR